MIVKLVCKYFGHKPKLVKTIKTTKYYDKFSCRFEYVSTHCECARCKLTILRKVG